MTRALLLLVALFFMTANVRAVEPNEMMDDPALEARAREVSQALRCVVCQNETIDESHAELAHDMRLTVRSRIAAGDSNEQVLQFMVQRYGDFVLMKPRFMGTTVLLWLGPLIILLLGGFTLYRVARRPRFAPSPLSSEEMAALAGLNTGEPDGGGADEDDEKAPKS